MNPNQTTIQIRRVDNGWVLHGYTSANFREGYMPDGTNVARTPDELSRLVHEWASMQRDEPK